MTHVDCETAPCSSELLPGLAYSAQATSWPNLRERVDVVKSEIFIWLTRLLSICRLERWAHTHAKGHFALRLQSDCQPPPTPDPPTFPFFFPSTVQCHLSLEYFYRYINALIRLSEQLSFSHHYGGSHADCSSKC
jgi:hypothetical protein